MVIEFACFASAFLKPSAFMHSELLVVFGPISRKPPLSVQLPPKVLPADKPPELSCTMPASPLGLTWMMAKEVPVAVLRIALPKEMTSPAFIDAQFTLTGAAP